MDNETIEYEEKIKQRQKNYCDYYEIVEPRKRYSLSELIEYEVLELMDLMPQNLCVDEHSDGYNKTKYITSFCIHKVVDGSWNLGFYENNNNKLLKDQYVYFEVTYAKDLKIGLIDLFLMAQNKTIEYFSGVKSGRIKLYLGDSWDDREKLGLL